MRLDDFDSEEEYSGKKINTSIGYTLLASVLVVLLILLSVLVINKDKFAKKNTDNDSDAVSTNGYNYYVSDDLSEYISGSNLTADDLDFWHDYDEETDMGVDISDAANALSANSASSEITENNPATDGLHTLITYSDGSTEWLSINQYLTLNTYNYSNLIYVNSLMKYYDNQINVSTAGVELSKNDDYVDFYELQKAGIEFCMLKLGSRGYASGEINMDENFIDNYNRANNAGLDVGLYFFSQAVTKEEAIEEAQYVLNTISENSIDVKYPIVFYMEEVNSNDVRTDSLSQMQRTNIAIAFMDTIRDAGYIPAICGNKEYLLKRVSFGSLIGYDVWYNEDALTPDFPYEFNMWRYTTTGSIGGVAGYAHLIISFNDYGEG